MKIRSHLLIFILGAVLPILGFSAIMTAVFWREQREALGQRFLDRVRGMTIGLDPEIDGNIRSLRDGAGQGFQITIRLPLVDRPGSADTPDNSAAVDKTSCRILVIEDNRDAARMMTLFLTGQGHSVEVAHTRREGLKAARGLKPDVILCDIGLPEFDGYKVVQQLRQEPDFHRVYLIEISGYGQEHDKERAWQAGFDAYLVKPIDLSEVERLLAKFCQENGGIVPSMM
jgi:CheY-like chemotaxis protein